VTVTQAPARGGPLDQVQLHRVDCLAELDAFRTWVSGRLDGVLCADTESASLAWHKAPHRMTQLGDKRHGWAFPPAWMGAAHEILSRYADKIGMFNSPYDRLVLWNQSRLWLPAERVEDAMTASWLADSAAPLDLKGRAARDIDPSALAMDKALSEAKRRNGWDWASVPGELPEYWMYSAMDPVLTSWLLDKHLPAARSQFALAYDTELAYADLCVQMQNTGMMIDRPYVQEWISKITAYRDQALAWLATQGVTSLRSNEPVGEALRRAGVSIDLLTDGGKPKIDKAAMIHYRANHPEAGVLIDAIRYAKKADDLLGKSLGKFLLMAGDDDLIHYSIHPIGAQRTGRSSVREPAMQTFDTDVAPVRGSYRPRPGHRFVTIDADQIEMRLAAAFSGDQQLIADFAHCDATGESFFVNLASRIYREPVAKLDPRYKWTKNTAYATIYGSGLDTAAATAGVSRASLEPVYKGFKGAYPRLDRMMRGMTRQCESMRGRPWVEILSGAHLTVDRSRAYSCVDYRIQGSAAWWMKRGVVACAAAGLRDHLRLTLHDEVFFEAPEHEAADVLRTAEQVLTDRETFPVPLTWSGAVLDSRWVKT
jgi:DNA polymerase I